MVHDCCESGDFELGALPGLDDGQKLSNLWAWGDDDEVCTLNFVTPEVRVAAVRLVVMGKVFDLGKPFGAGGNAAHQLRDRRRGSHVPFGGMKDSGTSQREMGAIALDFITETKTIYLRPSPL